MKNKTCLLTRDDDTIKNGLSIVSLSCFLANLDYDNERKNVTDVRTT